MTAETLVLLHGFTQTGAAWDGVVAALGERYTPLAPDIRGHGTASQARPVSAAACIGDVLAGAPERFVLGGYSMGGRVALALALDHPGRVERLVLVGASPGIEDPAAREARRRADDELAERIECDGLDAFAATWAAQPLFAGQPPEVAARAHADRMRCTADGLAAALRGLGTGTMEPLWSRLGELAMPVTLVAGERDTKFAAIAREMAGAIADARVVIVPGAGHAVHLECPQEIAQLF